MKKTFAILLILIFILGTLASCKSREDDTGVAEEGGEGEETSQAGATGGGDRPSLEEAAQNNQQVDEDQIRLVQLEDPQIGDPIAVVTTNMGVMRFVLYPYQAPKAVENFTTLAEEGFYNGKVFYYVEEGYTLQSGAVNSNGTGSRSIYTDENGDEEFFPVEPSWDLWHFRGALSLANNSDDLHGSKFVIVQSEDIYGHTAEELEQAKFPGKVVDQYKISGGIPDRDGYSTVFGMLIHGWDVFDDISQVEVDASKMPLETVIIESITIETYTGGAFEDGEETGDENLDDLMEEPDDAA